MVKVADLTITSIETITAFTMAGDYWYTLDELQSATISNSEDTEEITGKNGRRIGTLKKNKSVTVTATNGMVSGGLLETQTGGTFTEGVTTVMWTDYLTVNSDAATTSWVAVGTDGNEIGKAYVRNSDGTLGEELTQGSAVGSGVFTYDPDSKALTFNTGDIEDGTEIVVFYTRSVNGSVLVNDSDTFSGKAQLYVDAFAEDKCSSSTYRIQFYIPKADFSGTFDLALGDSQTTHEFEATALAGSCLSGGQFWTYTVIGSDAEDAA